jgi:hypothetical protein
MRPDRPFRIELGLAGEKVVTQSAVYETRPEPSRLGPERSEALMNGRVLVMLSRTARQRRPQTASAPKARLDLIEVNSAGHALGWQRPGMGQLSCAG